MEAGRNAINAILQFDAASQLALKKIASSLFEGVEGETSRSWRILHRSNCADGVE